MAWGTKTRDPASETLVSWETEHSHADLGALAVEVGTEVIDDVLGDALGLTDANDVLGGPGELTLLPGEARARALALWADVIGGKLVTIEILDIAAHGANKLHVTTSPRRRNLGQV